MPRDEMRDETKDAEVKGEKCAACGKGGPLSAVGSHGEPLPPERADAALLCKPCVKARQEATVKK